MGRKIFLLAFRLSLLFSFLFFLAFLFPKNLFAQSDQTGVVGGLVCVYPVTVRGNSMEPEIKDGSKLFFNKCIDDIRNSLESGTVVIFSRQGRNKIAVIRDKVYYGDEFRYETSRNREPDFKEEVLPEEIVAVYTPEGEEGITGSNAPGQTKDFKVNPLMILGGLLTMSVFFFTLIYWKKKTGVSMKFLWVAIGLWSIMLAMKTVMDLRVSRFIYPLGSVVMFLYFGLRTGILESGLSYLYARKKLKEASFNEASFFGIGYNGVEALAVGLWTFSASLVLVFFPRIISLVPANLRQEFMTGFGGSSLVIFAPVIERASVLLGGIFASLLVFLAARTNKIKYLFISVLYKTVIDGGFAVYLARTQAPTDPSAYLTWAYLVQIPIVVYGVIGLLGSFWVKKIYPVKNVV